MRDSWIHRWKRLQRGSAFPVAHCIGNGTVSMDWICRLIFHTVDGLDCAKTYDTHICAIDHDCAKTCGTPRYVMKQIRARGQPPAPPGFIAFVSVGLATDIALVIWFHLLTEADILWNKKSDTVWRRPRKPAMALMSHPCVALSSMAVKQPYYMKIPSWSQSQKLILYLTWGTL